MSELELVAQEWSGALIEEYEAILERPAEHVVAINQLLGAQFLCGNSALARCVS